MNDVKTNEQTANALSIYGSYNKDLDFADMRPQDVIIPRLNLMQYQTKPVKDEKAKAGDFFDSAAGVTAIERGTFGTVIPLLLWLEWIEWNPKRGTDKRILAREVDPNGTLAKMAAKRETVVNSEGKKVQRVSETYTMLVLVPSYFNNYENMMLLSFARSAYFIGKQWINRMKMLKNKVGDQYVNVPMPCAQWALSSEKKTKDQNDFMVPKIGDATFLDAETCKWTMELAAKAREAKAAYQNVSMQTAVDDDAEDHDEADAHSGPAL